jgi:hypothetical protein
MKSICWEKDKPKVFHIVTFLLLLSPNVQNLSIVNLRGSYYSKKKTLDSYFDFYQNFN